jgi:hypothetical protein
MTGCDAKLYLLMQEAGERIQSKLGGMVHSHSFTLHDRMTTGAKTIAIISRCVKYFSSQVMHSAISFFISQLDNSLNLNYELIGLQMKGQEELTLS